MMGENGDLPAECHYILNGWKNYYSQLLNVHSVISCRYKYITAQSLVPDHSPYKVEIAISKLKNYKSPDNDEILAGPEILWSECINSLILSQMQENCLLSGRVSYCASLQEGQ
jgi:hypothetical protein